MPASRRRTRHALARAKGRAPAPAATAAAARRRRAEGAERRSSRADGGARGAAAARREPTGCARPCARAPPPAPGPSPRVPLRSRQARGGALAAAPLTPRAPSTPSTPSAPSRRAAGAPVPSAAGRLAPRARVDAAAAATQPPRLAAQPQSRPATTGRLLPERAGRARRPAVACRWRGHRWRARCPCARGHRFLQLLVVLPPRGGRVVVACPTARRVHVARRRPRSLGSAVLRASQLARAAAAPAGRCARTSGSAAASSPREEAHRSRADTVWRRGGPPGPWLAELQAAGWWLGWRGSARELGSASPSIFVNGCRARPRGAESLRAAARRRGVERWRAPRHHERSGSEACGWAARPSRTLGGKMGTATCVGGRSSGHRRRAVEPGRTPRASASALRRNARTQQLQTCYNPAHVDTGLSHCFSARVLYSLDR